MPLTFDTTDSTELPPLRFLDREKDTKKPESAAPLQTNAASELPPLRFEDGTPDYHAKTQVLWAGIPTTREKIIEAAARRGVTPDVIMELGTPLGQIESRLASTVGGETFLEIAEGVKAFPQSVTALGGKVLGGKALVNDNFANKVYADMRRRRQFLDYIEGGGDVESVLGERGNRIYTGLVRLATQVTTLGAAAGGGATAKLTGAGTLNNYSFIAADTWGHSLNAAQQQGFTGNESIGYAALHTTLATALLVGGGQLARKAGALTAFESFSPALRANVSKELSSPESVSLLKRAASEFGGWAADGAQFGLMDAGSQLVDIRYGLRDKLDYGAILDSAAQGVLMRGSRGVTKGIANLHKRLAKTMPERAAGVRAAEIDLSRGVNPFEVKDITDPVHFAKETGHKELTERGRDSYREALDFYVNEARRRGEVGGLEKLERDVRKLREEDRQQKARIAESKQMPVQTPRLTAAIRVSGKTFTGVTHAEAVRKARKAGAIKDFDSGVKYSDWYFANVEEGFTRGKQFLNREEASGVVGGKAISELANKPRNKGKAGESQVSTEPVVEQPRQTANERATFSAEEFEKSVGSRVRPVDTPKLKVPIDTRIKAPWEPETRVEASLRVRSRRLAEARQQLSDFDASVESDKRLSKAQMEASRALVEEYVPAAERDNLYNRQVNANTPGRIRKFLGSLRKYVDSREHQTAKRQLYESLRKASNLRTPFAEQIREIRKSIDFHEFRGKDVVQRLKEHVDANPNMILSAQNRASIERLSAKSDKDFTPEELRQLSDHVQDIAYQSALQDRLVSFQGSVALQDTADAIVREAKAAPPFDMQEGTPVNEPARSSTSRYFREGSSRPEAVLEADPTLRSRIYDEPRAAQNALNLDIGKLERSYDALLETLGLSQGRGWKDSVKNALGIRTPHDKWAFQERNFGDATLTREQAMDVMWRLRDQQNLKDAWGTPIKNKTTGKETAPLDGKLLTELDDFIGKEGRDLIDFAFKYGNGPLYEAFNATNDALTGRPVTQRRNIVPREVKPEDEYQRFISQGRLSDALQSSLADSYGHLKHREGGKFQLTVEKGRGFTDKFLSHARRMHQFARMAIPARNAELMFNNPEIKQAITNRFGAEGYRSQVDMVRRQVSSYPSRSQTEKQIRAVNSAVTGSHIAVSPVVWLSQVGDPMFAAGYSKGGWRRLAKAANELMESDPRALRAEMENTLLQYAGEYHHRNYSEGGYAEVQTSGQHVHQGHLKVPTVAEQFLKVTQGMEQRFAQPLNYLVAKAEARERFGLDPQDRKSYAHEPAWGQFVGDSWQKKTFRGSTSSDPIELSGALRMAKEQPALGLGLVFLNQAKAVGSLATIGNIAWRQGNYSRAGSVYASMIAGSLTYAFLSDAFSMRDRSKDTLGTGGNVLLKLVDSIVGAYPGFGNLIDEGLIKPFTQRQNFNDNPVVAYETAFKALNGGANTVDHFTNWLAGQEDQPAALRDLRDAAKLLSFYGLPAAALGTWGERLYTGDVVPGLSRQAPKQSNDRSTFNLGKTL